jgi:hypothetical protein
MVDLRTEIAENEEGHFHLAIARYPILTMETREQAEAIRDNILAKPALHRMLGEYSPIELAEFVGFRASNVKSDVPRQKLRSRWGRAAEDEWNVLVGPNLGG